MSGLSSPGPRSRAARAIPARFAAALLAIALAAPAATAMPVRDPAPPARQPANPISAVNAAHVRQESLAQDPVAQRPPARTGTQWWAVALGLGALGLLVATTGLARRRSRRPQAVA